MSLNDKIYGSIFCRLKKSESEYVIERLHHPDHQKVLCCSRTKRSVLANCFPTLQASLYSNRISMENVKKKTIVPCSYKSNPPAIPCTFRRTKLFAFELLYECLSRIASSHCFVVEQSHKIFPDHHNLDFLTYIWLTIILAIYSHKLCPFLLPLTKQSPSVTL